MCTRSEGERHSGLWTERRLGAVRHVTAALIALLLTTARADAIQQSEASPIVAGETVDLPFTIDGPPPPLPPAVISRDETGRTTIRAVRLAAALRLDGKLDEPLYARVPPMSDFIQMEPQYGAPATEKTELWLSFDRDQVYLSFRCWESQMDRIVANEMRRDGSSNWQGNDIVSFIFDTFYDRRNGMEFTVNAIGGRGDGQVTSERQYNSDWNPIWEVKTGRFEGGWTIEAAVPFKSLRYRPGRAQIWGFNVFRTNRWKNELSFLTRVTAGRGQSGLSQLSLAATVVGLEAPSGSKNLEIKPYGTSNLTTDLKVAPQVTNKAGADLGLDVKYGVTQNLTADFTYRTDFAQVEADEQQINLTRFNLQFPEKREFFLENRGTFQFAGAGQGNFTAGGGGGGGGGGGNVSGGGASGSDTPQLFYSRRIGLDETGVTPILVPILAGARLTGRVGRYSVGLLNIRTDEQPASGARPTSFSVARVNRDILRKSTVGVMFTGRSVGRSGAGTNEAYGVDGTFGFFDNLSINTYWARTRTGGLAGDDTSYRAQLDYSSDRYGLQLERLAVGDHFNPEIGFVRRKDMRRDFAQFRFSPRPLAIASVRKFFGRGSVDDITNGAGRLDTRTYEGEFAIEFQNSDRLAVVQNQTYEYLKDPFSITSTVVIPGGGYDFTNTRVSFNLGPQRTLSAFLAVDFGTFYDGHKKTVSASRGRLNLTPRLSLEPTFSVNWIELPEGSFTTNLFGSRVTYTMTPEMFVSALLQYSSNSNVVTANVRLRWEYRPGSELFVVYNEQRDTLSRAFPDLAGRAFIVKVNRLFRY